MCCIKCSEEHQRLADAWRHIDTLTESFRGDEKICNGLVAEVQAAAMRAIHAAGIGDAILEMIGRELTLEGEDFDSLICLLGSKAALKAKIAKQRHALG